MVKWYLSLKFKLFSLMTVYLLITVVAISWQNGRLFWNLLEHQSIDNTVNSAKKASSSLSSLVSLWSSSIYAVMHTIHTVDKKSFKAQTDGMVFSNREFLSFEVFSKKKGRTAPVVTSVARSFSPHNSRSELSSAELLEKQKRVSKEALSSVQKNLKAGSDENKTPNLVNLQKALGIDAIQLQIPFTTEKSATEYWAVLTIWAPRLAALLELSAEQESVIANKSGKVFLAKRGSKFTEVGQITSPIIEEVSRGVQTNALQTQFDNDGIPIVQAASFIPGTSLILYVRKHARSDALQMQWRMRKIAMVSWMFLLLTILASYIASGSLTSRINKAIATTRKIALGDTSARVELKRKEDSKKSDEVDVLAHSVNHMAGQIRNLINVEVEAARQEKELKTAQIVQKSLFSNMKDIGHTKPPPIPGDPLRVFGHFKPASECAGDWWYQLRIKENSHLVVVADATGHGASAALLVAMAYSFFHSALQLSRHQNTPFPKPHELIKEFNHMLFSSGQGQSTMTLFLAEIDSKNLTMEYSNAGHVSPLLIPKASTDKRLKSSNPNPGKARLNPILGGGVMLGFEDDIEFTSKKIELTKGDRIVLFTDGLTETLNAKGEQISTMDLRREIAEFEDLDTLGATELGTALVQSNEKRTKGVPLNDDVTVVVVELQDEAHQKHSKVDSRGLEAV